MKGINRLPVYGPLWGSKLSALGVLYASNVICVETSEGLGFIIAMSTKLTW